MDILRPWLFILRINIAKTRTWASRVKLDSEENGPRHSHLHYICGTCAEISLCVKRLPSPLIITRSCLGAFKVISIFILTIFDVGRLFFTLTGRRLKLALFLFIYLFWCFFAIKQWFYPSKEFWVRWLRVRAIIQ